MTQLTENVFAVEVPEGMNAFKVTCMPWVHLYELDCYELGEYDEPVKEKSISLSPGNWQFICTTKEATEEQARGIVQIISNGKITGSPQYRRYDRDPVRDTPAKCWTRDSRHALETLIASKGLDSNKNYCLLKKVG